MISQSSYKNHRRKSLIVNWGTEDQAKFPLKESLKLGKYDIYLATATYIPDIIKKIFTQDHLIYTNPYNAIKLLEDISKFSASHKTRFDIITTFFEMNVYEASLAAAYFQCKKFLSPIAAARTSVNKYLMRTFLSHEKITQPRYGVFAIFELDKLYKYFLNFKNSVVIKPVKTGHSYGARLIAKNTSYEKFQHLVKEAIKEYNFYFTGMDDAANPDTKFLIEEHIPGNIYSIDGIVRESNDITFIGNAEFEMIDPPLLQQIGHTVPIASLNWSQIKHCEVFTRMIIKKLDLQYCGFHCELKYYQNKPWLIEIGARLPGGDVIKSYQEISEHNIFDIFWSVFEDKKVFKKQKKIYTSESQISLFADKKTFPLIQTPINSYVVKKDFAYEVKTRNNLGLVYDSENTFGNFLMHLNLYSKTLKSAVLKKKRDEILTTLKLKLKINNISKLQLQFYFWMNKLKKIIKLLI